MNQRQGDAATRAILEWVDFTPVAAEAAEAAPVGETKPAEINAPETKPETKPESKPETK
jgi:hypothetical protein